MEDENVQKVQLVSVVSPWSFDTIRAYIDQGLHEVDRRLTNDIIHAKETARDAQANAQLANTKSEKASDDRFQGHNEFNRRIDQIVTKTVTGEAFQQFVSQYSDDKLASQKLMSDFVPKAAYEELRHTVESLASRIISGDNVTKASKDSKDDGRKDWSFIFSLIAIAIVVVQFITPHFTSVLTTAK
jgi:hypothetical protein